MNRTMFIDKKIPLLHISYYFYPIVNPRSIRWANFLEYLSQSEFYVEVLTIKPDQTMGGYTVGMGNKIPASVNIIRTTPGIFHHIISKLSEKDKELNLLSSPLVVTPRSSHSKVFLRSIWRNFFQYFLIPDRFADWIPVAFLKGLKLFSKMHYKFLLSSGMPFSSHVVAFLLKCFFRKTFWVAEYGDPWSFFSYPPLPPLSQRIHCFLERMILKKVDVIIVTTEETRLGFLKYFSFLREDQVVTIPQGADLNLIETLPSHKKDQFTIAYTGRFDPIRDPMPFFEALEIVKRRGIDLEFVMAGPLQDFFKEKIASLELDGVVNFLGSRPQVEALQIAKSSHLLLYFGNMSSYQLPSKIWEYIGLRRPVLAVTQVAGDIGAGIVEKYRRGIIVSADPAKIADEITWLYDLWREGGLESSFDLSFRPEVDWKGRAEVFTSLLKKIAPLGESK